MSESIQIRHAAPEEATELSDLAIRSKAYWGYSRDFLDACRSELTIAPEQFLDSNFECFVAVGDDSILGFYSLDTVSSAEYELDALFVEPDQIGRGIGRMLVNHAIGVLSRKGAETLVIQGDPHAADFYLAIGAHETGERESESIPGRYLPLFEIDVRNHM
jgi:GNAT superfamily N-acetyltransferase